MAMGTSVRADVLKEKKYGKAVTKSLLTKSDKFQLYALCALPLLCVVIFCYLPMVGIIVAFKDYTYDLGIFKSKWVGLKNFEIFFKSRDFLKIIYNTLYLNAVFIVTGTIAAIMVAVSLFEMKSRNSVKTFQTILITPNFLSWVVVSYMVYALLNPEYGMLNRVFMHFGHETVDWYSKPAAWPAILTITNIWKNVGMDSVVYYAALMGISNELFEAAEIDGAGRWKRTLKITVPCLLPLIVILTILKIGGIFRADFGLFYQVTRNVGTLYSTTDVMDTYIFRTMRIINNMGMSTAAGILQSVVGLVLVLITNYLAKKIDADTGLF